MSDDDIENDFDTDDFDTDGFDDGGFDDLDDQSGTLGDLWRNNPLVKIGVILAALAFLVGGIIIFGGKKDDLPQSRVTGGSELTEAPGSAEITPAYRDAIEEENTRRIEQAMRDKDSAIPMPVEPPKGSLPLQFEEPEEEDPLERWRRMQEARIREQQVREREAPDAEAPPEPVDTRTPAINALAGAMSAQMEGVLGSQKINGPILQRITAITYLESLAEKEKQRLEEALATQQTLTGNTAIDDLDIILPAGTIEYAQTIIEANTDAPGPVLAQIVTGPLKGARIIGSFSETYNYLTLNFNTIVLDGVDYAANGIALDPETTLPGVITDINRRYFRRVVLPTAAAFVTGLTSAIANSGTTTVTISGDTVTETTSTSNRDNEEEVALGLEEAGKEIEGILDEVIDQTKPMLRVAAGTPIGILFITPVVSTPNLLQQRQQGQSSSGAQLPVGVGTGLPAINNLIPTQ